MALGLGQQLRIVRRVGGLRAGRDVADGLVAGREHRQDELLGLALRQRALDILGRDARGAHQGHAQAGHVEGVAGARPERAAGAAQRAGVRVVADVVVQEVEDVLRVVIELRRLFLDERVGRVGVGRGGEQVGIDDVPGCSVAAGVAVRDGAGVERGEGLGAGVELQGIGIGQRDGQRDAGPVVALDRAQAPGQVLAALVRAAARRSRSVTPGASVSVSSTPVSGSACSL